MSAAQVDPHDKMRARDVSKVVRGEQAPRPAHEYGTVSPPPKLSSSPPNNKASQADSRCYENYVDYHKCIQKKGQNEPECEKFARNYKSLCSNELIKRWDEERERGTFDVPI